MGAVPATNSRKVPPAWMVLVPVALSITKWRSSTTPLEFTVLTLLPVQVIVLPVPLKVLAPELNVPLFVKVPKLLVRPVALPKFKVPPDATTICAVDDNWLLARICKVPPLLTATLPATATTEAFLASCSTPALTVATPVKVFAPLPLKVSVPAPAFVRLPLVSGTAICRSFAALPLFTVKLRLTPPMSTYP